MSVNIGRSIQTSFLPDDLPDIDGYELAAWWEPAELVSGDYYDVFALPDGRPGLVVADVSGHGVGPSLIMASARAMIHVLARSVSDPAEIVRRLSHAISPDLHGGRFITLIMVALDPATNQVTYANAGHSPALCCCSQSRKCTSLDANGLPIGISTDTGFPENVSLTLEQNDALLLATDGTIELKNTAGEMFGRERLEQAVAGQHQRDCRRHGGRNAPSDSRIPSKR